jgi:hypothetical protein
MRRFLKNERGQTLVSVGLSAVALMTMAAMGIETGHVYYAHRLLQTSTNVAALAAAQAMPDIGASGSTTTGTGWGNLYYYSSATENGVTGQNASNFLQSASIAANFYCSSTLATAPFNISCQTPPNGEGSCTTGTTCNAVKVTQTAQVHLWFGGLVGFPTFNLKAIASAASRGGGHLPYNIAVIIDTTRSMGDTTAPASDGCGGTKQIQCAVSGVLDMLEDMYPCVGNANTTCTASSSYADAVALYVFPAINVSAVSGGDVTDDTTCPSSNPPIVPYGFEDVTTSDTTTYSLNLPAATGTFATYGSSDAGTYQVVPFNETYKTTNGATTLSTTDPLAVAVGAGGCNGLQAPGGEGTYYAQVIYAAQNALIAQQNAEAALNYQTQNVMIILSDGDANACNQEANTANGAGGNSCSSNQIVAWNCPVTGASSGCHGTPLNGTGNATNNPTADSGLIGYISPAYPSELGQCGQAVQAAQYATQNGTMVYTVAMGAETSGSCTTDVKYSTSSGSTYGAIAWPSGPYSGQACNAIEAMASDPNKFFSDNTGGCPASSQNTAYTTIGSMFKAVGAGLTTSRLIPDGT